MIDLGMVNPGETIRIPFSTFKGSDGSSLTMTNFAAADVLIYKDGSTTQRASTNGITATTDFDSGDGLAGCHLAIIDLSDNSTADFYAAGSEYLVRIANVTVDAVTVGAWVARFKIGYSRAVLNTTIATLASQTSFTLTSGPAEDNAILGWAIIHDAASAVQKASVLITAYTGSTKTVTLAAGASFTLAAKDNISILGQSPSVPFASPGAGGLALVGTHIPTSLVSGRIDASVGAMAANVMTAAAAAADFGAELADAVWDEALVGHNGIGSAGVALTNAQSLYTDWADGGRLDLLLDAALADTNELQTDWVNGGRLDLLIDAIKAKTDALPSDPADASDIAALIDALPTAAEVTSAVWAAASRTLTAIDEDNTTLDLDATLGTILAAAFDATLLNKIADHVLRRTAANVFASSDGDSLDETCLYGIIRQLQKSDTTTHDGFLTIFNTDGSELAQIAIAVDASADPVTGVG